MAYDYSQAGYSPEVTDYLNQLEAQRAALVGKYAGQNVGLDRPDILTPMQVQQPASDEIRTEYMPEEAVRAYMAQNPTISESMFRPGVDVRSYGGSRDPSVYDVARLPFGGTYTLTNKATGQTYKASTPEQIQAIAKMAMGLSTTGTAPMKDSLYGGGNNLANYEITDASGNRIAYDLPYTPSFLKQAGQTIADIGRDYVLPAAFAYFGGPAGAVMGSFLSGTMQDKSTEDLALNAAIAGGTAYGMQQAAPYLNSAAIKAGLDPAYADMLFSPKDTGLFGKYSSGTSPYSVGGGGYSGPIAGAPGVEAVQVSGGGSFYPGVGALSGVLPAQLATSAFGATNSPSYAGQPGVEEVNVSAKRTPGTDEYGAPFFVPTGLAAPSDGLADYDTGEQLGYDNKPADPAKEDPSTLDTIDKYLTYAKLGMTGLSLLGGLVGGGGSGSGTGSSGMVGDSGKMPANFATDKLPTGDAVPAFGGGTSLAARTARPAADFGDVDWNRYGFNPEKSFFPGVPQRAAKGGSMAVARPAKSYAVQGAGDGRSDDIPAVLSDGEYVIDAETVALLGNGSNKAGAAQLDRFRANVRKHKGKELAKGRFSINAKNPQAYFKGGA